MEEQRKELNEEVNKATSAVECIEPISANPEFAKIIDQLQPEQREVIIQAIKQEAFSGPIPHPELLQKYECVKAGFAERIVSMAETQLNHRVGCETKIVDGSVDESKRGQNYAFFVSILFLAAAVYLGINDHDWLAGILGGGTLGALVTVFITGRKKKD